MITYHANGTNLRLRLLLVSGSGTGITAQAPTLTICRRSNGEYWTGAAWQAGTSPITMVEDSVAGSYYYDFDQTAAGGSSEEYQVRYVTAAPYAGLDEEQHVFRPYATALTPERRLGHALADDGVTLRISLWIEEGGTRAADYASLTAQVKDYSGNLVVNFGTNTTDTADGLFYFETPIVAIQRNIPYVLTVQAIRAMTTDSFNAGFVRV